MLVLLDEERLQNLIAVRTCEVLPVMEEYAHHVGLAWARPRVAMLANEAQDAAVQHRKTFYYVAAKAHV